MSFAPSAVATIDCSDTSQNVGVSATDILVTNYGTSTGFVSLSGTATFVNGIAITPGTSLILLRGSATVLGAIGAGATLNVVSGTNS